MVMRWNKEEEGSRRCVVDGVVIVVVDGVDGVVVFGVFVLGLLAVASQSVLVCWPWRGSPVLEILPER